MRTLNPIQCASLVLYTQATPSSLIQCRTLVHYTNIVLVGACIMVMPNMPPESVV